MITPENMEPKHLAAPPSKLLDQVHNRLRVKDVEFSSYEIIVREG